MDMSEVMGYVNYRCRGPGFPLSCDESVANLVGSVENRTTEINKVEVLHLTLCVLIYACVLSIKKYIYCMTVD